MHRQLCVQRIFPGKKNKNFVQLRSPRTKSQKNVIFCIFFGHASASISPLVGVICPIFPRICDILHRARQIGASKSAPNYVLQQWFLIHDFRPFFAILRKSRNLKKVDWLWYKRNSTFLQVRQINLQQLPAVLIPRKKCKTDIFFCKNQFFHTICCLRLYQI